MAKMKILQPEMIRLKDLHKNDKVKLQQEMMALYKREKVNPVSGCLPVLIQIPFFFAIYKMLYVTLEMRHQPFFGWIEDLSARDPTSIFNFFGLIPWDPPSFFNDWSVANIDGFKYVFATKIKSNSTRSCAGKNIYVFSSFFNNYISSISFRPGCILDSKQHINHCSTVDNYAGNKSKNSLNIMSIVESLDNRIKKFWPKDGALLILKIEKIYKKNTQKKKIVY